MSNPDVGGRTTRSRDDLFATLADDTRRELLRLVVERSPAGIAKDDLAFELAAVTNDKRLAAVTDDEYQRARVDCHHRSLPALLETDLVAETDDGTIVATDHWAVDDPAIEAVISGDADPTADISSADLDALFGALADSRRRTVLSVLADQYHPISVETLARDVAAREADATERDVSRETVDEVRTSLVHVHLPTLNDAGLVGYDADSARVSYEGHPVLRASWLGEGADDAATGTDEESTGARDEDVRTLEGRETIVTAGQSLCERADDELFMLFTTTGLLEEGCFRRIEDALDRGVDVYLGTRDPRVRELVRERAPEVVLWEPRLDWLNLPPEGEAVGRLVFADREAAMVGTIGSPNPRTDECTETAILGEGADNGFVVLMRQLLGPRLDRLDSRGDADVRSEIPL